MQGASQFCQPPESSVSLLLELAWAVNILLHYACCFVLPLTVLNHWALPVAGYERRRDLHSVHMNAIKQRMPAIFRSQTWIVNFF